MYSLHANMNLFVHRQHPRALLLIICVNLDKVLQNLYVVQVLLQLTGLASRSQAVTVENYLLSKTNPRV